MRKIWSAAILTVLFGLPMQMVMISEPVSAQTASDQKAMAKRLVNQGNQLCCK